jgi:hypothetical protein
LESLSLINTVGTETKSLEFYGDKFVFSRIIFFESLKIL